MDRIAAAHAALFATLENLTDEIVRQPSNLPDWTVGHVLSHIAFNAEAFVTVADALAKNEPAYMYPLGAASRDIAIEEGSGRRVAEIAEHVRTSAAAFAESWPKLTPEQLASGFSRVEGAPKFDASVVLGMRLREVEVHHVDCGFSTYTHEHWPNGFVESELVQQLTSASTRSTEPFHVVDEAGVHHLFGDEADSLPSTTSTKRTLLAWSLSRLQPSGFPVLSDWAAGGSGPASYRTV